MLAILQVMCHRFSLRQAHLNSTSKYKIKGRNAKNSILSLFNLGCAYFTRKKTIIIPIFVKLSYAESEPNEILIPER